MRARPLKFGCLFLLMVPCACSIGAQAVAGDRNTTLEAQPVRVIRDPHNGMRWLLERGLGNTGGPGRMVLSDDRMESQSGLFTTKTNPEAQPPLIRSGDKLVIEERSALVEARLEAVSLGTAVQGMEFNARLVIGGKVVRAVALAPGHAAFASRQGATQP